MAVHPRCTGGAETMAVGAPPLRKIHSTAELLLALAYVGNRDN